MAKNVEIQMEGLKKRLTKMRKNISNPSPMMQKSSLLMYKDVQDHFVKEKNPDGGSWKKSERAKKQGGYTLRDHNFLFRSLQASNTKDEAKVTAGNAKVNYAGYHQYGKGDMKRKFMWISKGIRENITKLLGRFFIGNML